MTTPIHTFSGAVRAATFLTTRERLDGTVVPKTRRGKLKCNPPNKPCGSRCIPPSWDCRLKNEGGDTHLRAVKTDPLGGFANIQRGSTRVAKGIVKGNFSEVYGGKQAIIRGVVKVTPGNIQQKSQLRSTLEKNTSSIGIGLAVVTGGLGIHTLLKKNNTLGYRYGLGRDIDKAVFTGVGKVLDVLPVIGADRARVRSGVSQASAEAAFRQAQSRSLGPEANAQTLGSGGEALIPTTPVTKTLLNSHSNLQSNLNTVNMQFKRNGDLNYLAWDKAHRKAFWSSDIAADDLGPDTKRISVFARPAAEAYLATQFGFELTPGMIKEDIKVRIQERLIREKQDLLSLAEQKGFSVLGARGGNRYVNPKELDSFISSVVKEADIRNNILIKDAVASHIRSTLKSAPSTYANSIYADAVRGFSKYYSKVDETFDTPDVPEDRRQQTEKIAFEAPISPDTDKIQKSADNYRTRVLAQKMSISSNIAGPEYAGLVKRAFFATRVHGPQSATYSLSDRAMRVAASEISGQPIKSTSEAHAILVSQGFSGLRPPRGTTPRTAPPSPAETTTSQKRPSRKPTRTRRLLTEDEIAERLMKSGMSEETAKRVAAETVARRKNKRSDVSDVYYDSFTLFSLRLDKPCGKSFIPQAHKCNSQNLNLKDPVTKPDGTKEVNTSTSSNNSPVRNAAKAIALALGATGAVAATAVAVDAARYFKNNHLPQTSSYKDVLKTQLKKDGLKVKDSQQALSNYYDEVTKDWKLGEVVYYKQGKDPHGHFGIYLGKREGRHQFAGVGANAPNEDSPSNASVGLTEYGPGAGKYDSKPVIWAKAPDHVQPPRMYSDTEIVRRAKLMLGKPYKLDMLENNCEAWSTMIVSGVPYSTQSRRFTAVTQALVKLRDKMAESGTSGGPDAATMATWLAFNHKRYVADSASTKYPKLKDPKDVLNSDMTELEAMSTVKRYLIALFTPVV